MKFVKCTQPDSDYQAVIDFVEQESIKVNESIVINDIPIGSQGRIKGHGHKEYFVIDDGFLEVTFEYAGCYEISVTAKDYQEVVYCEAAPFNAISE